MPSRTNNLKTLAIIGGNGMIGSDLNRFLSKDFIITPIDRENYKTFIGKYFDIVVNANGNSKRYWANRYPFEDFELSTISVYKTISDFPCSVYIYVSSSDVYNDHTNPKNTREDMDIVPEKLQPYGFHKYLSELIVKKYSKKFIILRLSMILGLNLRKGPFYDITNNIPLFIDLNSRLQLITTSGLAEVIRNVIRKRILNEVINIGGIGAFKFNRIKRYFNKDIKVSKVAETQIYEMNVKKIKMIYSKLKTSEEYLQEFLLNIKK